MSEEHDTFDPAPLNKETFSFFDVLSEETYPRDIITLYIDEAAAYDLQKLQAQMDEVPEGEEPTDEQLERWRNEAGALKARIENSRFTFYLTGVSDDRITDAKTVADNVFESKKKGRKNAAGHIEKILPEGEQFAWLRYFNALIHSLHIEQIVAPSGAVMVAPSPDEIAHFYDKAPAAEKARLDQAIQSLRVASSAYEASIDEGFLAKP